MTTRPIEMQISDLSNRVIGKIATKEELAKLAELVDSIKNADKRCSSKEDDSVCLGGILLGRKEFIDNYVNTCAEMYHMSKDGKFPDSFMKKGCGCVDPSLDKNMQSRCISIFGIPLLDELQAKTYGGKPISQLPWVSSVKPPAVVKVRPAVEQVQKIVVQPVVLPEPQTMLQPVTAQATLPSVVEPAKIVPVPPPTTEVNKEETITVCSIKISKKYFTIFVCILAILVIIALMGGAGQVSQIFKK